MRVLVVSLGQTFPVPSPRYGGETALYYLLLGFKAQGLEADLAAPTGSQNPAGQLLDTGAPTGDWQGSEAAYSVYAPHMLEYDVIASHQHDGYPYLPLLEGQPLTIVHTLQGLTTWQSPPPVPKPNLVTLTQWHRQHTKGCIGVDSKVIHNPISLDEYPLVKDKTEEYLSFGLIAPHKGTLEAISLAKKMRVDLVVAGETKFCPDPAYVQAVYDAVKRAGFRFVDCPNDSEKRHLLAESKAVILPFQVRESGSLLALEAQAFGTEVYMNKLGGVDELPGQRLDDFIAGSPPREPEAVRRGVAAYDAPVIAAQYIEAFKAADKGEGW